jgi:hypothetical protein
VGPCFGINDTVAPECDACDPGINTATFGGLGATPMTLAFGDTPSSMTGSLAIDGYFQGLIMSSAPNGVWTVIVAKNDGYGPCFGANCGGETGYWMDPTAVPEPPMLALFGLGMLAWGVRRRGAA